MMGTSFWVVDGTALKIFKYTLLSAVSSRLSIRPGPPSRSCWPWLRGFEKWRTFFPGLDEVILQKRRVLR
jgi:hypothetical protein